MVVLCELLAHAFLSPQSATTENKTGVLDPHPEEYHQGEVMTWQDGFFFAIIVVGSFVAGAIDAWREERKWRKDRTARWREKR